MTYQQIYANCEPLTDEEAGILFPYADFSYVYDLHKRIYGAVPEGIKLVFGVDSDSKLYAFALYAKTGRVYNGYEWTGQKWRN